MFRDFFESIFFCILVLISLYFYLFVSVVRGRPRKQLRGRPRLFLAKVRLLGTEIANHLFEGQRCGRMAYTGRARDTVGGPIQGRAQNEVFAAHYLASLKQAAMIYRELASDLCITCGRPRDHSYSAKLRPLAFFACCLPGVSHSKVFLGMAALV